MKKRLLLNFAALLVIGAGAQQLHATTLRIILPQCCDATFGAVCCGYGGCEAGWFSCKAW